MIYFLLALSIIANGVLVWYIRQLLFKLWIDKETREKFSQMIGEYSESLESIYRLEELYGEEVLKKAIYQTRFVQEACAEYKAIIEDSKEEGEESEEDNKEAGKEDDKEKVIRLKEGESVSQDAASYRRVIPDI